MNSPILRRGLSPEGCRNRQRQQGSLLNDEYGVTSRPIHKKIEKDFLKENVMRLKEIQAKCRIQESRPISGNQPVKAMRSTSNAPLSSDSWRPEGSALKENHSTNVREGSAHSDYFSLSDSAQNESAQSLQLPQFPTLDPPPRELSNLSDRAIATKTQDLHSSTLESKAFSEQRENSYLTQPFNNTNTRGNANLKGFKSDPNARWINCSPKFGDFYPHPLRRNKIGNVIEKIKSKKPVCDTSVDVIWKDIEKHHKLFFPADVSSSISTPRTIINNQKNSVPIEIKGSSCTKQTTVTRSQSLDRGSHYKANLKSVPLHNSTYTLLPQKQSSSNLLPLDTRRKDLCKVDSKDLSVSVNHGNSLPNLSVQENDASSSPLNLGSSDDSPRSLSSLEGSIHSTYTNLSVKGLNHDADECKREATSLSSPDLKEETQERGSSSSKAEGNVLLPQMGSKKSSLECTPVVARRGPDIKAPLKLQIPLLRSKSSTNLRLAGEPPPSYKRGEIPKYLKCRKAEAQRRVEAAAQVDPSCPPGHTPLPDYERRNTLHLLKKGQLDVIQKLSSLPVAQDTLRVRKLRQELEAKLSQIDEGIEIFSQPKVYVMNED